MFIYWEDTIDTLDGLDQKLTHCGGEIQKAQIFLGDPYTDDTLDGMYYRRLGGELIMVDPKERSLKMPKDFKKQRNLPKQLQALKQEF